MRKCPTCRDGSLKRGTTVLRNTVDGVTFEGAAPAVVCSKCREPVIEAEAIEAFELAIASELTKRGACTPEAFRFMRKAIGLRAIDLAELLGVEPETVSRWENGARALDRGAFALLGGLVADRVEGRDDTRRRLQALRKPVKRSPRVVRVRAA